MLIEKIKEQIKNAMKTGDNTKRDILKVALGEIQTFESRQNKISEEECIKIVQRIVIDNEQMIGHYNDNPIMVDKFKLENKILQELLPKTLSIDEMEKQLNLSPDNIVRQILMASSDGAATGISMKFFKSKEINVNGKDVAELVKKMRKEAMEIVKEEIERIKIENNWNKD